MMREGDDRPTTDQVLMESARLWATRSTCSRARVGVVIGTIHGRTLSSGYNGAPAGMTHCDHTCECRVSIGKQEEHTPFCPAVQPCLIAVHAEANAIAFAARYGTRLERSRLYSTVAPCVNCAMLIINAGIYQVFYLSDHRDMGGVELLDRAGVEVVAYRHDA